MYVNTRAMTRLSDRSMFSIDIIGEWAAKIANASMTEIH